MISEEFKSWYKKIEPSHEFGEDTAFDKVIFEIREAEFNKRKVA